MPDFSPNAPIVTNDKGGKQSDPGARFDLFDPFTMIALAEVTDYGAKKYGDWNWRRIPVESHLNHLLTHVYAYMSGNTEDKHLEHAFCRAMFALSLHLHPDDHPLMMPSEEKQP